MINALKGCQIISVHDILFYCYDLDLLLSNIEGEATVCDSIFTSDHFDVAAKLSVSLTKRLLPTRSMAFSYKRSDWNGLRNGPWIGSAHGM